MFLPAKIQISEQNTKFIWIFSSESIFSRSEKIVQIERKTKIIWNFFRLFGWFTFFVYFCTSKLNKT